MIETETNQEDFDWDTNEDREFEDNDRELIADFMIVVAEARIIINQMFTNNRSLGEYNEKFKGGLSKSEE